MLEQTATSIASPFPAAPRVIYGRNTLTEVVCQLSFPRILRITEPPVAFQERIRRTYPRYAAPDRVAIELPGAPPELVAIIGANVKALSPHGFTSDDGNWVASLEPSFLALSAKRYERWEEFSGRLDELIGALHEIYAPAYYERVGLRYINAVDRNALGLKDRRWSSLLGAAIGIPSIDNEGLILQAEQLLVFDLGDSCKARLVHGLTDERGYRFDSDLFRDVRTDVLKAKSYLSDFNVQARYLFRWCVNDELHAAMDPRPVV